MVLTDPRVPESRRACGRCAAPVGRARFARPGRDTGYCAQCGSPFTFRPQLQAGEVVAGQYEVMGALAHGGLGWIYLAVDRKVSDRWVVLKGLINHESADAMLSAAAEQRFLAQVSHPAIVKIFNVVAHAGAVYTVMEYVGGVSLRERTRPARGGGFIPLPVDQALAFGVEVLDALGHLHELGLLYCDLKPDNILHVGREMRLIDLGAVRRVDDTDSAVFGTVGFQAPEVAESGPSVAADLYTVGRTLLAVCVTGTGLAGRFLDRLPTEAESQVLAECDPLHRLLRKACAAEPADRFTSAQEMREQALGVLRAVSRRPGAPGVVFGPATASVPSAYFRPARYVSAEGSWRDLPVPRSALSDPSLDYATMDTESLWRRLRQLSLLGDDGQARLERARLLIMLHELDQALGELVDLLADDPWNWRVAWWTGVLELVAGQVEEAAEAFNTVLDEVPGEAAARLALGYACELAGRPQLAEQAYLECVGMDAGYVPPAAFGLYRLRESTGDLSAAMAALELVSPASSAHLVAVRAGAALLVRAGRTPYDIAAGLGQAESAEMGELAFADLQVAAMRAGLELCCASTRLGADAEPDTLSDPSLLIGGFGYTEPGMRSGLEYALRHRARLSADPDERVRLVDEANRVRPWSRL